MLFVLVMPQCCAFVYCANTLSILCLLNRDTILSTYLSAANAFGYSGSLVWQVRLEVCNMYACLRRRSDLTRTSCVVYLCWSVQMCSAWHVRQRTKIDVGLTLPVAI